MKEIVGVRVSTSMVKVILTIFFVLLAAVFVWSNIDEFREVQWPSPFAVALVRMSSSVQTRY